MGKPGTMWASSLTKALEGESQTQAWWMRHLPLSPSAMTCLRLAFGIVSTPNRYFLRLIRPHNWKSLLTGALGAWNVLCFSPWLWEIITCGVHCGAKVFTACFGSEASLRSSKLVWSFIVFFPLGFNYGCLRYFTSEGTLIAVTMKQWK